MQGKTGLPLPTACRPLRAYGQIDRDGIKAGLSKTHPLQVLAQAALYAPINGHRQSGGFLGRSLKTSHPAAPQDFVISRAGGTGSQVGSRLTPFFSAEEKKNRMDPALRVIDVRGTKYQH